MIVRNKLLVNPMNHLWQRVKAQDRRKHIYLPHRRNQSVGCQLMKNESAKSTRDGLAAQLKSATEILEIAASNRAVLAKLSVEERTRLLTAAREIFCPDVTERRRLVKAKARLRKADKLHRDQSKLNETGIRKLRREKVFTTPNVFPPQNFQQQEIRHPKMPPKKIFPPADCFPAAKFSAAGNHRQSRFPRSRRTAEPLHLQTGLLDHPAFLRPALSEVRGAEFYQAHGDGGFARARGVAHRRTREDRLSGRHQTAARRGATHRLHAFPARLGDAIRGGTRLQGLGPSPGNFRPRPAPHAERGGVLQASAHHAFAAGFHH